MWCSTDTYLRPLIRRHVSPVLSDTDEVWYLCAKKFGCEWMDA